MKISWHIFLFFITFISLSCQQTTKEKTEASTYPDITVRGAMRDVMWKGELQGKFNPDTIQDKNSLYGLGPESYLTGELLINNGKSYVSRVVSDSTMLVEETYDVEAPFFVYGKVNEWTQVELPDTIDGISALERFIDQQTQDRKRPFCFKLTGTVHSAVIHIQNLPEGAKVSSPQEAHQGQKNYHLDNQEVEIIGFFSTQHKGIFTHHDSFLHMHLITADQKIMGHVDQMNFSNDSLVLHLPVR